MGLYKRKDSPFWWWSFRTAGRRTYGSTGTDNKRLADRIHAEKTLEVSEGRHFSTPARAVASHVLFSELAARYIEWAKWQKGLAAKKSVVKKLVGSFGKLELDRFNVQLAEGFQSAMLLEGKARATVNRHIETLKHMFTKAGEWELVREDSLRRSQKVKLLALSNKRLRFLSREEGAALVAACDPHLKPIVVTALNTGMRKGEILGLEWDKHVDLKHGFLLLDVTKNGERRELPINQTLRAALQGIVRRIHSPFVFCDKQGRRFRDVKRSFSSALRRAGLKNFRFHDLRHTFASQLVMSGVDLTTVSRLLGHKSLTMTLRYAHLAPAHMLKAVSVLDAPAAGGYEMATLEKEEGAASRQTP